MVDNIRYYLAGPMSGIKSYNFPAFIEASETLRTKGYTIISPAELYDEETRERCLKSIDGNDYTEHNTWGDCLSRDVKIVSDGIDGVVFLPGWEKSRGAKLEAFVALLCEKKHFALYCGSGNLLRVTEIYVRSGIIENMP